MKWKDSNDTVELDAETGDDPKDGKSFSIKKDNGIYHSGQNSLQGKKMPVMLVGGGILILVVLIIWLIYGSGGNSNVQQVNLLEPRVKALEDRLSSLEPFAGAANIAAQQEKTIAELTRRIDGLEAVFTKEIDSLSKRMATVKPQKTAAPLPAKSQPDQTAPGTADARKATHHVVQAGENLYRISLRYNIKLDELLRLNNLKPGAAIQPGQKLLVSPQKP
ncbi:MAG: LysM peptidoglycan-binding domain-containing protein [Desulfobacterales bacterium]|nr:LysM peptidoglycan-binding domain-containing protein [Desulfobacterales bacterium]